MTLKKLRVENLADSKCKFIVISYLYLSVIPVESPYSKLRLGPVKRIRILENDDFLSLPSTRKRRFAAFRKGFRERSFLKMPAQRKRRFSNTMISYLIQRIHCMRYLMNMIAIVIPSF